MSEGPDLKSFGDEFTKKLESIVSSVGTVANNVTRLKEDSDAIRSKVDTLESKKEEINDNDIDAYEDPTEKKIKALEQKIQSFESAQQQSSWLGDYDKKCAFYDTQAIQKFPHIKDENSEAFKKTQEILKQSEPIGKHPVTGKPLYAPDALLNAAYRAKVEYQHAFKSDPEGDYEDMNFNFSGGKKVQGREITEIQKQIAARLGVKVTDRLKERAKTYNSTTIKKFAR